MESSKILFWFCSSKSKIVLYICLQYGKCKQNWYHSFDKTASICESQIDFRIIYSLLNFLSTGERFKPNPSAVDKCKPKLWVQL